MAKKLDKADIVHTLKDEQINRQITLFDLYEEETDDEKDEIIQDIKILNIDDMTPRQAMEYLYELKKKVNNV